MRNFATSIPMSAFLIASLIGVIGCNPPPPRLGKIVGSSMSPTLRGSHYSIDCPGCGIQFSCDLVQADERATVICPNCGSTAGRDRWTPIDADPVSIVPESEIKRWDIIAFKRERSSGMNPEYEFMTKRVVGLPGEAIQFENGNVFANQVLISKPLEIQKQMRVLVCDSNHQATPSRNWILSPENPWEYVNGIFQMQSPADKDQFTWFDFHFQKNYFQAKTSPDPPACEDYYGYNQSLSRKLNRTDEVFVELNAAIQDGSLGWRFGNQDELYEFRINQASSKFQILVGKPGETPQSILYETEILLDLKSLQSTKIEFSSFDRVLRVIVNGTELWVYRRDSMDSPVTQTLLSFGASSDGVKFEQIRIWRDIYYFDSDTAIEASRDSSNTGFFVIGDNVPLSHDSRHWDSPGVGIDSIQGKVIFE